MKNHNEFTKLDHQRVLDGDYAARMRQQVVLPFTKIVADYVKAVRPGSQDLCGKINDEAMNALVVQLWFLLHAQMGPKQIELFDLAIDITTRSLAARAKKLYREGVNDPNS